MIRRNLAALGAVALFVASPFGGGVSVFAQAAEDVVDTDGASERSTEVVAYASAHAVSTREALRRLMLQDEVGLLEEGVLARTDSEYAGVWIEHDPEFRVVVATSGPKSRMEAAVGSLARTKLDGLTIVHSVQHSLRELEAAQVAISKLSDVLEISTAIDVMSNRVVAYASSAEAVAALRSADLPVSVQVEDELFVSRPAADAYAGQLLGSNGCTSGFTLVYTTTNPDTYSTTTAGHCGNTGTLNGVSINYTSEIFAGHYDIQWGSVKTLTPRNWMRVGTGTVRTVTGRTPAINQAVGAIVCKYGNTTKQTCGKLISKGFDPSWVPGQGNGFHQVSPDGGPDMVNGGDSGGPVYKDHSAWGIVSGEFGLFFCVCDLIYDPVPRAEGNAVDPEQPRHIYYIP
jgi:hypothetical protein